MAFHCFIEYSNGMVDEIIAFSSHIVVEVSLIVVVSKPNRITG